MHVTDVREEVMFHLEIQSTDIPVQESVVVREVRCREQLMNRPAVLHLAVAVGQRILRSLDYVRRLEYNRKDKSAQVMHRQEANRHLPPRNGQQPHWQDEDVKCIKEFRSDENRPFRNDVGFLFFYESVLLIPDESDEILHQYPHQRKQSVEKPRIQILKAVKPFPFTVRGHPQHATWTDIFVYVVNVRVRVVEDVVLYFPIERVAADKVQ